MLEICNELQCTGCASCANRCPQQCITMQPDTYGYIHPVIDQNECIDCQICIKACPVNNEINYYSPQKAYAAWSLDSQDRETSTSGGIASVLSQYILSQNGIVYGAAVCHDCNVTHIRVSTTQELHLLKGSKYVQSSIHDCYKKVKEDLIAGKQVLFTGTPCQVAGLAQFLVKPYPNLTTMDLICHGVPSLALLHKHIESVCDINQVTSLSFREKEGYILDIKKGETNLYRKAFPYDTYLNGFMYGLFYRSSCYQCLYAKPKRISDITIGDFWGLGLITKFNHSKDKVSVILPNTPKGENLIQNCSHRLFLEEREVMEAINGNAQLQCPAKKHESYDLFRKLYPLLGYKMAMKVSLIKFFLKHYIFNILIRSHTFNQWYIKTRKKQ